MFAHRDYHRAILVFAGIILPQPPIDPIDLRLRGSQGDSGTEPPNDVPARGEMLGLRLFLVNPLRVRLNRRPDLGIQERQPEVGWHHADDGPRLSPDR